MIMARMPAMLNRAYRIPNRNGTGVLKGRLIIGVIPEQARDDPDLDGHLVRWQGSGSAD